MRIFLGNLPIPNCPLLLRIAAILLQKSALLSRNVADKCAPFAEECAPFPSCRREVCSFCRKVRSFHGIAEKSTLYRMQLPCTECSYHAPNTGNPQLKLRRCGIRGFRTTSCFPPQQLTAKCSQLVPHRVKGSMMWCENA